MRGEKPSILFVGPMLGRSPGWVPNPMEILAPKLTEIGYRCLLTSSVVPRFRRWADILATIVRRRDDYDVVCLQVYSGPNFVVGDSVTVVARILGKPVVTVLHGGDMPRFARRFPAWVTTVLGRAKVNIAPSSYLAEVVADHGIDAEVIPNMIPLEKYEFVRRARLRPRLLWMRTFHPLYNPTLALRVLARIHGSVPYATLTMAGQEKGMLAESKQMAADLGLTNAVRFVGFADEAMKVRLLREHDLFLNTNRIDNMPISVIEACAAGMPVVATDVGGLRHLLRHGESGWLVPDGSATAMADGVLRLLGDPELASRLSVNGRFVAEKSAWDQVGPQWEVAFSRAVG